MCCHHIHDCYDLWSPPVENKYFDKMEEYLEFFRMVYQRTLLEYHKEYPIAVGIYDNKIVFLP